MTEMPADIKAYNRKLIEQFRASGGDLGGRQLVLLTTTGARTGLPRTTPMMYVRDGERVLVLASNAGAARHPDWYHNLVANPAVTVELGGETYPATAEVLTGEDREQTFARIAERYAFFAEHQTGISREIPVVALVRHG